LTPYLQHSTSAFSEYIYKALERLDNRERSQTQSQSDTFSSFKFTTQQQQPQDLNPRLKLVPLFRWKFITKIHRMTMKSQWRK